MSLLARLLQTHVTFLNFAFVMPVSVFCTKLMPSYFIVTKLMSSYLICNETHVVLLDCNETHVLFVGTRNHFAIKPRAGYKCILRAW